MSDKSNILDFGRYNLKDIPTCLRQLADKLEKEPEHSKYVIVCSESKDRIPGYSIFGEDVTRMEALGLVSWIAGMIQHD